MRKKIIATLILFTSITFNAYAEEVGNANTTVNTINYSDLKNVIFQRNITVKINQNAVDTSSIRYNSLIKAEEDILSGIRSMENMLAMYKAQSELLLPTPDSDELNEIYLVVETLLKNMNSNNIASIKNNIASMEEQLKNIRRQQIDMTALTEKLTLQGEMLNNQMVWTAENLIFVYNTIDEQKENINKNIDMLQEQLRILKIQQDLGYVSSLDIEGVEFKLEELNSTKEALDSQKLNVKRQLNLLFGQSYNTPLEISFVPEVNIYEAISINSKEDLNTAIKNSYELRLHQYEIEEKQVALTRTKNDEDDGENSNEYKLANIDLENENLKFEDAKRNYELKFQQLYETVKDKQKTFGLENKKLSQEKSKMEAAKKKYDLGVISKKEYDDIKFSYDLESIKVETAKIDLFTAHRKYEWMLKGLNI